MLKVALYTAATVFTALATILAALYVFDIDIFLGSTLLRFLSMLEGAILFVLFSVWIIVASLEFRSDK